MASTTMTSRCRFIWRAEPSLPPWPSIPLLSHRPSSQLTPRTQSFFPLFSSYIYHLVDDLQALRHTTLSVLRDFARDGVVYLELRTTPRALPRSNLSKAGYIAAILDVIREFESSQDTTTALHARLIISVDRRNTLPEALEAADLAVAFKDRGVVGVDLCGDPTRGGIEALQPAFERARAAAPGLGVTLHFAEAEASGSDEELLMLLRAWGPDRIGHVIHVSERVKREIVGYPGGLGLELCLSCNVNAGMISGGFEAHHFGEWCKCRQPALSVLIHHG